MASREGATGVRQGSMCAPDPPRASDIGGARVRRQLQPVQSGVLVRQYATHHRLCSSNRRLPEAVSWFSVNISATFTTSLYFDWPMPWPSFDRVSDVEDRACARRTTASATSAPHGETQTSAQPILAYECILTRTMTNSYALVCDPTVHCRLPIAPRSQIHIDSRVASCAPLERCIPHRVVVDRSLLRVAWAIWT